MNGGRRGSKASIELRHLRYFVITAEELNYGRAAERLGIAQPGLSQQIQGLEEIIGTALFDRSKRAIRLTPAGELFLTEARKTVAQSELALLVARRAGRGEVGRIAIGYVGSAAYTGALTAMIGGFRADFPDAEIQVSEMEMIHQLDQIAEGKLDVGFIRPPVPLPAGVCTVQILMEEIVLALPAGHRLADLPRVPLSKLREDVFITPRHPPDVSFHRHTTQACRAAKFSPALGPQGRDFVTIVSMVAVGLGVALVPKSLTCIQLPGICYRPIGGPKLLAELALASRRSETSPAARAFVQYAGQFGTGGPTCA
jgi:DNA-binding transcriptional LysR family regulator